MMKLVRLHAIPFTAALLLFAVAIGIGDDVKELMFGEQAATSCANTNPTASFEFPKRGRL